jgi:glucose-6-phosphate dehydrogenase assembly protein OpcA
LKLSNLIYAGAGYALGARAGRARYEQIVRVARRVAGSQTVQSTAGLAQARLDQFAAHARQVIVAKLNGQPAERAGVNGYRH